MSQPYSGRLELTWTNKPLRLLAQEDGSYEWVSPSDYRVAEVRLLDSAATAGTVHPDGERARDNLLIRGDALNALTSLIGIPEFARDYVGKVKLAYLDPPFNTQQSFLQYDDALEHSVWLTMMRDRLLQVKTLLSPDGSVWVHCDDSEQAYLKVMMDEVFGRENFVATIVWQKRTTRENRATFSQSQDYILVYAPAGLGWKSSRNMLVHNAAGFANPDNDPRGQWTSVSLSAQGYRPNQMYKIVSLSGEMHYPPKGGCWKVVEAKYNELLADNRIYFPKGGAGRPRRKTFLSELEGLVPETLWSAEGVGTNDMAKREIMAMFPSEEAFATPKPEPLLQRIIHIATNPGDIVLDCFLGSGTTAAVAQKMGRRWVGIERSAETMETYTIPRLTRVIDGSDRGGISEAAGWNGGGGFRVLDVAPSMFVEDGGVIYLAGWATSGKLAEATAAQLGYEYRAEPPFCGRKGRSRLAVVDGLVNEPVIRLVAGALREDERAVICGTAIDLEADQTLRELRPGSSVRKIPASILAEFRQGARWMPRIEEEGTAVWQPRLSLDEAMEA